MDFKQQVGLPEFCGQNVRRKTDQFKGKEESKRTYKLLCTLNQPGTNEEREY